MAIDKAATGSTPDGTVYDVYGSGEPVVLIHGVGLNRDVWEDQLLALSPLHQTVVYDTLGHGDSQLPPTDATLADYSAQLLSLLDHLRIPAANVVGHSMGALIALDFAMNHPSRVLRMAALSGVFIRSEEHKEKALQRAQHLLSSRQYDFVDATISRWFGDPVPPELQPAATKIRAMFGRLDPVGYARAYRTFAISDSVNALRFNELIMPCLYITGELDHNSSPSMSLAMAELSPQASLEIIKDAGHMITMTHSTDINRSLESFMAQSINNPVFSTI